MRRSPRQPQDLGGAVVVDDQTLAEATARVEALIPGFGEGLARLQRMASEPIELELLSEPAQRRMLPVVHPALMENNLARKGVWSTDPDRGRQEYTYTTEDLVGSLTIEYSLGQLSTSDMELVAWVMGRWRRDQQTVSFTLREYARACGVSWHGKLPERLKTALHRIDRTRFTGRVWEQKTRKFVTTHFGIVDKVQIVERKDSFDGPALEPGTVTITLSSFVVEQLLAQQFVRLDWRMMRNALTTPLARRLYVFLRSQEGFKGGTLYEITIDHRLIETLGSKDRSNPRRFRGKLVKAGEEIVSADPRFELITIRAGRERNAYILHVRRRAA